MTLPAAKDLLPILPELTLVLGGLTILTAAIVAQHTRRLSTLLALGTLAIALLFTLFTADSARFASFGGMLLSDGLTDAARLVILLAAGAAAIVCLLHALPRTPSSAGSDGPARTNPPEYFLLLLGASTGLCLLASTTNLLVIFLAMELASLPSYVLAGWRKDTRHAAEASLKYVLLGSVAAAMFAFGASILFACYNTLDVAAIAASTTAAPLALASLGVWAIALGIAFKIAAVPMHFWCPDVFQGATADIGLFLSVASKAAALILAARLVILSVPALPAGQIADTANLLLAAVAIATMTLANLAALSATSLKRLAGWSSIAHAGYMLSLLVLTSHAPDLRSTLVAYLVVYLIMNTGFFAAIAAIEAFEQSDRLEKLHRLARTHPVLSASLAVCIISLIGLPPTAGFTAKLLVLLALPSAGWLGWTLAVALVINTVLSLAYYLPILRRIYLPPAVHDSSQTDTGQTDTGAEPSLALASAARPSIFLCLICAILLILTFLFQGLLLPWLPL
jgi:NADH-quinone oxidoreductase subunit N